METLLHRRPRPRPRGSPLPRATLLPRLARPVAVPRVEGILDFVVVVVLGVVGAPSVFRRGVAFMLAKLVSVVIKVVSLSVSLPMPVLAMGRCDRDSFASRCRCCF